MIKHCPTKRKKITTYFLIMQYQLGFYTYVFLIYSELYFDFIQ